MSSFVPLLRLISLHSLLPLSVPCSFSFSFSFSPPPSSPHSSSLSSSALPSLSLSTAYASSSSSTYVHAPPYSSHPSYPSHSPATLFYSSYPSPPSHAAPVTFSSSSLQIPFFLFLLLRRLFLLSLLFIFFGCFLPPFPYA